ncbi:MAG: helix-turn-helix domain-containing protein [Halorientalis sp.]
MELTDIGTGTDADSESADERYLVIAHHPTRRALADAVRSCLAHANQIVDEGGVDAARRARYSRLIASGDLPLNDDGFTVPGGGFACGIEDRQCVRHAVRVVETNDDMRHVVVDNLATFGETQAEVRDHIETIVQSGAELHVNDTGVVIDSDSADEVLGVLDSLDRGGVNLQRAATVRDVRAWIDDRSLPDRGRAPLGFEYVDGELVTADEFDEVRGVLLMVLDESPDGLSKRKAAERLGCAPRTVGRALDNLDRYGLEDHTEE